MTVQQFIEKAKRNYMRQPQDWLQVASDESIASIESKGKTYFVRVSPSDADTVRKYRWYLKDGYAVTSIAGKRVKLHRLIFKPSPGREVDHISKDRLDNRRENLRIVTRQENAKNRSVGRGYRRKGKKWEAYIQSDGKQIYLGMFDTEVQAEEAYLEAKKHYHAV